MSPERSKSSERYLSKGLTPTLEQAREFAQDGCTVIPIYRTLPGDLETPGRIYLKLTGERTSNWAPSFLLESVEVGEKLGRYSYVAIDPKFGIEVPSDGGWIERSANKRAVHHEPDSLIDPLHVIEFLMPEKDSIAPVPGLPPFSGGFIGYLGYECINRWEPKVSTHKNTLGIPDSIFFEVGNLIVYDHIQQQIKILTNIVLDDPSEVDEKYQAAQERIGGVVKKIRKPLDPSLEYPLVRKAHEENEVSSNFTEEEYMKMVDQAKEHILAGDIFQIVTSQRLSKKTTADPYSIYRRYRTGNPSPYTFFMDFKDPEKDFQLIGTSPEIMVKVEGNEIVYRPLAGTRPRGFTKDGRIDEEADKALEEELRRSEKECAEHVMLVDLGRNDVGRVAKPGSLNTTSLMTVERYSRVMHLSSEIHAELDEKHSSFDAIRSTFPAGTVSGAPKVEAMKLINKFEPERRGPYSGAVGYISYSGDTTMAIAIRTLVKIGDTVYLQAGGGLVADSDPQEEFNETMRKASAGLGALDLAEHEEF